MPIGKLDQTKHKPSSLETLSSTDSTLESRISSNDIPKMELLKINYVSQTKQTVAATRSSPPATRSSADHHVVSSKCRVDGDVGRVYKYLGYMRPNSHPEISKKESHYESWDFLQNKRAIPTAPVAACEDCRDCCSECSDCSSTTADSLCFSPAVEKSLSWNYRTKLSAVKKQGQCGTSRAERYRKIDKIDCGHDVVRMRPLRQPVATKSCSDVSKIQQMFEQQRNQAMKRESMEPLRKSNSRQADSPRRRTFSPSGSDERIKKLDGLYDSDCCECTRGRKSLNEPKSVSKIPKKVEKNVDPKVSSRNFVRESKTEEQFSRREKMLMDYKSHNEPKEQLSRREKDLSKAPTELQQQFNRWDKKLAESKSHGELKDLQSRNVSKEFHAQRELQDELVRRDKKLVDFKALVDSKDRQSKQIDHSNHQRHSKKVVELPLHGVHLRSKDPKELVSWQTRKSPDKSEPRNESNEQFNRQIQKMFQSSQDCSSSSAQQVRITRPRGENHVESITPTDGELPTLLDAKILRKRIDKSKVERIHIRKKRQPLLIVNQLSESAQPNDHEKPSNTNIKYPEIDQSSKSRNTCGYKNCTYVDCPMSSSDHPKIIDSEADHAKKVQELVKDNNMKNLEKSTIPSDKIICNSPTIERKKLSSADEDHNRMKDQITIVINRQSDPNDVQNFSNKNLTKATTDELLSPSVLNNTIVIKSSSKTKMSNVDVNLKNIENRKFNDLKNINHWIDPEIVDHHRSHEHSSANSVKIFVRNYPVSCSSSADSNSLSDADDRGRLIKRYDSQQTASGSSCVTLSSSSVADEDDDDEDDLDDDDSTGSALSGDLQKYQSDGSSNCSASVTISSATGTTIQNVFPPSNFGCDGGFWNNCYFYDADKSNYCCSAISCDDDNCPYYDLEEDDQVDGCRQEPPQPDAVQHKRNPQKTDVIHDMRPRSMDGVVDSGVSLNGDTGSSPDSEHMQNQQDLEARRLKRGHVLSELLETERIYVTEMSSILKGYCDQMQSEEMMHLVPASLQGKEDILFGNLHEMYTFHSEIFLKDLENCISTTELVALCFVQRRDTFYRLYSFYCQNIPRSERLRETLVDTHLFLQECQKRLGHKLPLAAYLLKPVQRITKYQLLLKDLLRFSDSGSCTKELQKALDCMLIVLKCVNDSMHQIAITGFPSDLSQQGELLLQDSFQVWTESKKDIRLRIKPQQRHIFLYQKSMLFCKQTSKMGHNKSTYQFKHYVKMSQIGLTESVRGDPKRFEVWLQGRQEVHTLQAPTIDVKNKWVAEVKRVLFNQLQELKGEKIKQYSLNHRGLQQTASWDTPNSIISTPQRTMSCDASSESNRNSNCSSDDSCPPHTPGVSSISSTDKENPDGCGWSSDYSNSEDEMSIIEDNSTPTFLNILAQWAYNHDSGSYPRASKSNSKFYVSVEH